jgi:S-DNA-T family DNA segregation ATPase FtsK/SpoIIIE
MSSKKVQERLPKASSQGSSSTSSAYTRTPTERQPLPNRLVRLLSEARWLALAVLGLYFVLILISYDKMDPGWSHGTLVPKVHNLGGRAGAWMSDLLLYIFGFSAWWWAFCLLRIVWQGYRRLTQKYVMSREPEPEHSQEPLIRTIGFVLLFIGSVGLEYLRMYSLHVQLPRAPGGVLGQLIGHSAHVAFGFTGATLLLLLLFGLGLSLFFHVSWLTLAERIGGGIEMIIEWFVQRYQYREDRRQGEVAAVKREEVVVIERAKHVEKHPVAAPPVKIEPQVVTVVKSERVEKERQANLFEDLSGDSQPAAAVPAGRGAAGAGNRVRRNAGIHQPPDREEAVGLRRRGQGGGRLSGPGRDPLRDRAGHRRQGQPDRRPGARPGAFAVADVDPRGRNHPRQELHGAGAAESEAPDRAPDRDRRLQGLQRQAVP